MNYATAVIITRLENAVRSLEEKAKVAGQQAEQAIKKETHKAEADRLVERFNDNYARGRYYDALSTIESYNLKNCLRELSNRKSGLPNYGARDELVKKATEIGIILELLKSSMDEKISSVELERLGVYRIVRYQ